MAARAGEICPRARIRMAMLRERLKAPLRRFRVYQALRFAWHVATDPVFRRDQIVRMRRPRNLFQYRSLTLSDRYPVVFAFVQQQLRDVPEPRVLSFGCATGEEVFSLRSYLPQAVIKGIDINPGNIATCVRRRGERGDHRMEFAVAESARAEPDEIYDAIFCMAVFQHQSLQDPAIRSCERYITFAAFDETLAGIARALKIGGLLAIRHADFRFTDTACSAHFRTVLQLPPGRNLHPRFDRENRRLPDEQDVAVVFQKLAPTGVRGGRSPA